MSMFVIIKYRVKQNIIVYVYLKNLIIFLIKNYKLKLKNMQIQEFKTY